MAKKQKQLFHYIFNFQSAEKGENLLHNIISEISENMKSIEYNSFYLGISGIDGEEQKISLRNSLIDELSKKFDKKSSFLAPDAFFIIDFKKNSILLYINQAFIYGKYNKFLRNIAQTEHFCKDCRGRGCEACNDTGRTTEESVEQLLADILIPKFNAKQLIFHGGGREDVDVLMLGMGREFVAEITVPKKRNINLKEIEEEINKKFEGKIAVHNLELVNKDKIKEVKDFLHEKIYKAKIHCEKAIDEVIIKKINSLLEKEIEVEQLTPTRVSKRRVLKKRDKLIEIKKFEKLNEKEFVIELRTTHGTYVKEFISGDGEKTSPSLSSLLENKCKCIELDVLEII